MLTVTLRVLHSMTINAATTAVYLELYALTYNSSKIRRARWSNKDPIDKVVNSTKQIPVEESGSASRQNERKTIS